METGDAFGLLLHDHLEGRRAEEIVERDDGLIMTGGPPVAYFAPFRRWLPGERKAMRLARGRVLDVGCGAGRVALHLQERDHEVVAVDISPLAVDVSRRRGVRDARVMALADVRPALGRFDTVVLYGNNFGLVSNRNNAVRTLTRLRRMTTDRARILAQSADWSQTTNGDHLANHERNRRLGRMPGQNRLRVRYRTLATPWFDYLLTTPEEMEEIASEAGWRLARRYDEPDPEISLWVGVLERA